ncbi:MAG: tRNA (adenosine(37)-N6)-dimethylallyltransferase MiaA [Candidatus Pacebacteria bacterium]|nr:tRNA (adenosine(37)-N6)-dimethylallyltransferase MiaA [Candidatus Paceibacterota bacterium]
MQKVFVILGQTTTGKSALAVKLAKKINGEIISADSRQVYTGLNIGSGKVTKKEMAGVPHHLLDVVSLKKKFSVAEYQKLANSVITEIIKRGKVPIIVGGTGFYIDAVTKGIVLPEVPPNPKLRKELEKKSLSQLVTMLKKLDPARVKNIDVKNKVRLIRAIEISKTLGKVPKIKIMKPAYEFVQLGLFLPEKKLRSKISTRLKSRMTQGMLREAKSLNKNGLSWKRMRELGLEYRFMALHLEGKINKKEMIEKLEKEIYQYAKRQMTWFKRDQSIIWFDASKKISLRKIGV